MSRLQVIFGLPGVFAPDERVVVHAARVSEALNRIPCADLELLVEPALDEARLGLARWPGAQGVLRWTCRSDDGAADRQPQLFAGVVTELRMRLDGAGRVTHVALRLHAWPAAEGGRSHARRHQFYEGRHGLELAEAVFRAAGGAFERSPAAVGDPRPYEVQYAESDEDFVLRVLGEDRLVCAIAPDWRGDGFPAQPVTLRLAVHDALPDLPAPPGGDGVLAHRPHRAAAPRAWHGIHDLTARLARGPSEVALAAVAPEQPQIDLRVAATVAHEAHAWIEVAARVPARTRQRLGAQAEAMLAAARRREQGFESALPWARAGHRCRLEAGGTVQAVALLDSQLRFERDAGGEWVLSARATALDVNGSWLPPCPPRPVLPGLLHGTVLDAAAEPGPARQHREPDTRVHADAQGRIRVRIAWQARTRSDDHGDSSIWLRLMTPWAGHGAGFLALPRAGQEVLVGFVDGDAAQPVVLGALYAAVPEGGATPPWPTADGAHWVGIGTRSDTGQAQHLRLSGDTRRPRVELHGAADLDLRGGCDIDSHAGQDWSATAARSMTLDAGRDIGLQAGATARIDAAGEVVVRAGSVRIESMHASQTSEQVCWKGARTSYTGYLHSFNAALAKHMVVGSEVKLSGSTNQVRGVQFDINGVKSEITLRKDEFKLYEADWVCVLMKKLGFESRKVGVKTETAGTKVSAAATRLSTSACDVNVSDLVVYL